MKYFVILLIFSAGLRAQLIINEVMFNSPGSDYNDEFVEIYNDSDGTIDLSDWKIGDQDNADNIIIYDGFDNMLLSPRSYCVILDPSYITSSTIYEGVIPDSVLRVTIDAGSFGSYGFSNTSPETVMLFDNTGALADSYTYTID